MNSKFGHSSSLNPFLWAIKIAIWIKAACLLVKNLIFLINTPLINWDYSMSCLSTTSKSTLRSKFGSSYFFSSISLITWLVSTIPSPPNVFGPLVFFTYGFPAFSFASRASLSSFDSSGATYYFFFTEVLVFPPAFYFYLSIFSFIFFCSNIIFLLISWFSNSSCFASFLN